VDVRVDERRCQHRRARAVGLDPDDEPVLHRDPEVGVDALAGVDDASFEDDVRLRRLLRGEHHATTIPAVAAASTGTGPWTSRSYSTAMRTTRPLRTWVVTSASAASATAASISTPRFIGPGCMTFWPGRK